MKPSELQRWRKRRFPATTEKSSRGEAARWYGVGLRAWEHYEQGTRSIPQPLVNRIEEEKVVIHGK
jgi:hypothetical protein